MIRYRVIRVFHIYASSFVLCSSLKQDLNPNNTKVTMDLAIYNGIILTIVLVPLIVVFSLGFFLWYRYKKSEIILLMLVGMKSIVSRKNIDKKPTYLVCDREFPSSVRPFFMIFLVLIFAACVQLFFFVAIVDVTYECVDEPGLDCFKKNVDVNLLDTFGFNQSPVNCSSVPKNDFYVCYRVTILDAERAFLGAAAAYLLFEMLNFGLLVTCNVMLWAAEKWSKIAVRQFKFVFSLTLTLAIIIPVICRIYVDEVESALRQMSYIVLVQIMLVGGVFVFFVGFFPCDVFAKSKEYFVDASLPNNVGEHENEVS